MKCFEVLLQWQAGDLVVVGLMLRTAPNATFAMISARGWTAFFARVATMEVRVLRVRRVLAAEELVLRRMGLPRPWATPQLNLREYPGQGREEKV
jgi:hypothetical protein